jgi:hypothetical protein
LDALYPEALLELNEVDAERHTHNAAMIHVRRCLETVMTSLSENVGKATA